MIRLIFIVTALLTLTLTTGLFALDQETQQNIYKTTAFLTGAIMAGEAVALYSGTHLIGNSNHPWINRKNDLFLGLDVLCGAGIIAMAFIPEQEMPQALRYSLVGAAVLSHGYRDWEYAVNQPNAFCFNLPLFVVNNVKLIGTVTLTGYQAGFIWLF